MGVGALSAPDQARVGGWDRDIALLLDEARRSYRVDLEVPLPASLSASAVVRLARDPDGLARDLARPMPRPPAPAAARGTRFHAWVESRFDVVPLIDRTDLAGAADDVLDDEELAALQEAFLAGPYAGRAPHRVEAPFQLVLGDRVVRGRIDAVYRTDDGYDVVDWKTGRTSADPVQLAVYRLAWARVAGVPVEQVGAAFYYVATGRVVRPDDLLDADALEALPQRHVGGHRSTSTPRAQWSLTGSVQTWSPRTAAAVQAVREHVVQLHARPERRVGPRRRDGPPPAHPRRQRAGQVEVAQEHQRPGQLGGPAHDRAQLAHVEPRHERQVRRDHGERPVRSLHDGSHRRPAARPGPARPCRVPGRGPGAAAAPVPRRTG